MNCLSNLVVDDSVFHLSEGEIEFAVVSVVCKTVVQFFSVNQVLAKGQNGCLFLPKIAQKRWLVHELEVESLFWFCHQICCDREAVV